MNEADHIKSVPEVLRDRIKELEDQVKKLEEDVEKMASMRDTLRAAALLIDFLETQGTTIIEYPTGDEVLMKELAIYKNYLEVYGNIHENPELLKEKS